MSLLLLSGDVEMNPGPHTRQSKITEKTFQKDSTQSSNSPTETTHEIIDPERDYNLADVMAELRNVKVELSKQIQESVDNVNARIEELVRDSTLMKEKLDAESEKLTELVSENKYLRDQLHKLEREREFQKSHLLRDNLIIRGLEQDKDETWDETALKVRNIITEKLNLDGSGIHFEMVHRVTSSRQMPQLVVAKFSFHKQRDEVFRRAKALKEDILPCEFSEDFTPRVREARRKLGPHLVEARKQNKEAYIVYDKLKMGEKTFVYDASKKQVIELKKRQQ
ncbi:uncharacterized protein [Ptychodera flava]|uniref:uncharacterized protein n=1 Tax=Ptychodera flava TaxID=63121 RepID=UPI00396A2177